MSCITERTDHAGRRTPNRLFHDLRLLRILAAKESIGGHDELVTFLRPELVPGIGYQQLAARSLRVAAPTTVVRGEGIRHLDLTRSYMLTADVVKVELR